MAEGIIIEKVNFEESKWDKTYEACTFISCDISQVVVQHALFDACVFRECNFSMAKLGNTWRDTAFVDCKMTGADFSALSLFSSSLVFERCLLDFTIFTGLRMSKILFIDCKLQEACFDEADINNSVFAKCDLTRATFWGTNLENVDFSTSFNFSIDPTQCKLKKTIFSEQELKGLVSHLDIQIV